jgi:outer membrane lipopolysaccharide assembly protein LptE/RlpB
MCRLLLLPLAILALTGCGQQVRSETPGPAPTTEVPWQAPAARWDDPYGATYRIDDAERNMTCYVSHGMGTDIECFPLSQGADE